MKISLDCIPCIVRQAAEAVSISVPSSEEQNRLLRHALQWISEIDQGNTPPSASQLIHRRLRNLLPTGDPYRAVKDMQNDLAAHLIPSVRRRIESSSDPLIMAVRYAITGNIIDLGTKNNLSAGDIYSELQSTFMQPIFGNIEEFRKKAHQAQTILYLADNAGEIFFDRLLIEQLPSGRVTLAVRGIPVINDATLEDAHSAGIQDIAEIIDNGSDAPGTILDDCSDEFRNFFKKADMVIAKGQGNFETLADESRCIFFLFRTKCRVISTHSGFDIGTYVAASRFPKRYLPRERYN